jgi:hypothetical protein
MGFLRFGSPASSPFTLLEPVAYALKLMRAPGTISPTHPAPTTGHAGDSCKPSPAWFGSAVAGGNDPGHLPPTATAG